MYRWLRNTHLLVGLFSFLFLMMYGASAVQMAHNSWFLMTPTVSERQATIEANLEARAAARRLMDTQGLAGELAQVRQTSAGAAFRIVRPGTVHEINYASGTGQTSIRTNTAGFMGMLNRIHHIGGLWHEYPLVNVWGALVALISAALIVLGATGIYLWFKIYNERLIGTILLAASLGFSLTLLVLIRTA